MQQLSVNGKVIVTKDKWAKMHYLLLLLHFLQPQQSQICPSQPAPQAEPPGSPSSHTIKWLAAPAFRKQVEVMDMLLQETLVRQAWVWAHWYARFSLRVHAHSQVFSSRGGSKMWPAVSTCRCNLVDVHEACHAKEVSGRQSWASACLGKHLEDLVPKILRTCLCNAVRSCKVVHHLVLLRRVLIFRDDNNVHKPYLSPAKEECAKQYKPQMSSFFQISFIPSGSNGQHQCPMTPNGSKQLWVQFAHLTSPVLAS